MGQKLLNFTAGSQTTNSS